MKSFWSITLGTLLLMAGVIWLLIATHLIDGLSFLREWWPIFIIVPFGIRMFLCPGKLLSLNGVAIGVILLLYTLGIIGNLWQVLSIAAPIAVIMTALHILLGRRGNNHHHKH